MLSAESPARRASQLAARRRSSVSPAVASALAAGAAAGASGNAFSSSTQSPMSSARRASALSASRRASLRVSPNAAAMLPTPPMSGGKSASFQDALSARNALPAIAVALSPKALAARRASRVRLRKEKSTQLGRALLRSSISMESADVVAARAEMAAALLTTKTPGARGGRRLSQTPPSRDGRNFSGTWVLNKSRSDDQGPMLQAIGVGWVARKAIAASKRTIVIEHAPLASTWVEKVTTSVITKSSAIPLTGVPYEDTSPVDGGSVHLITTVEEGGRCIATRAQFMKSGHRQLVRRWVESDGSLYHVCNELIPKGRGDPITCHTYFDRV